MAFNAYESSTDSSRAVEFFRFRYKNKDVRYTDYHTNLTVNTIGGLYKSTRIQRSNFKSATELRRSTISITAVRGFEIAELFKIEAPPFIVRVDVYRMHLDDPDKEAVRVWTGKVSSVRFKTSTVDLECMPVSSSLNRVTGRLRYQRACPYTLYDSLCGISSSGFEVNTTVASVAPGQVTVTSNGGYPDGYFSGGKLQVIDSSGASEYYGIINHVGTTLTLMYNTQGNIQPGMQAVVQAGCDHSFDTCKTKFNNGRNFGGCPYLPVKNPFEGARVV